MKLKVLTTSLMALALTACGSGGGGGSTPSVENPEVPCQVDCSGDGGSQGKITYSHSTNGNHFVADDGWNLEIPSTDADLTDSRMYQKSGEFSVAPKVGDSFTMVYTVNAPHCGTGYSRDTMFLAVSDNDDQDEALKIFHVQSNHQVKIYSWNTIINNMTAFGQITLERTDTWTCTNGIMTLGNDSPQNTLVVNDNFGYALWETWSFSLYNISFSASPADITSNFGFDVIYNNSYYSGTDNMLVNSGNPSPFLYDNPSGSNDITTNNIFNSFLGTNGDIGYIFGSNFGLNERTNFIILKNLEDKDLNSKNIFIGITSLTDITAGTVNTVYGMTP